MVKGSLSSLNSLNSLHNYCPTSLSVTSQMLWPLAITNCNGQRLFELFELFELFAQLLSPCCSSSRGPQNAATAAAAAAAAAEAAQPQSQLEQLTLAETISYEDHIPWQPNKQWQSPQFYDTHIMWSDMVIKNNFCGWRYHSLLSPKTIYTTYEVK